MKRKGSMMGSSKYEFNPKQFDIDMKKHAANVKIRREHFKEELKKLIHYNTYDSENFSLILDVLREIKIENKY